MSVWHDQLLTEVTAERTRLLSRRSLLTGGAKVAAGGMAAAVLMSSPRLGLGSVGAQESTPIAAMFFADDIEVLNFALTLEHLEFAFYRDGIDLYELGAGPFGNDIRENLAVIRDHELAHVETLSQVITELGGTPVQEAAYDFGYTDAVSFLATAAALENTGVRAYNGAGASIANPDLLTAAGTIVAVEARHASYLNLITGEIPYPEAFEDPATPQEVLEIAGPFIVG